MKFIKRYNESKIIKATDSDIEIIIGDEIYKLGNKSDLNHIDVSKVTNMSYMLQNSPFNGDISRWNVGNVINMPCVFMNSQFNGDISNWNVGNVTNMSGMLSYSQFNGDISKWDVGNVRDMSGMFFWSKFNGDISRWNVGNVENMFSYSSFNGDLNRWVVIKNTHMYDMFTNCPLDDQRPWWYQMFGLFVDKKSMYDSIEVYEWIDLKKGIIWKKRLNYALQDFGAEDYKIPNNIKGFTIS